MSSEKPEDSFDDTMAELLNLMKAPPTQTAANDLMLFYTESVEAHPSRADVLASTLQDLHHPLYTPIVDSDDESPSLADMLSFELAQFHSQGLSIDEDGIPIASSDLYLINCLLSGMSFKYRLAACPEQFANIMKGLDALPDNSSASELLVVGACIQLLTGGSGIFNTAKPIQYSMTEVATKLRFQKSVGTVKASNALKLLDLTISHAESGFNNTKHIDVWKVLFPSRVDSEKPSWPWVRFFFSCVKNFVVCVLEAISEEKFTWIRLLAALVLVGIFMCWACQWPPGIHHFSEFLNPFIVRE